MKKYTLFLLSFVLCAFADKARIKNDDINSKVDYQTVILGFIDAVKKEKKQVITEQAVYPIPRAHPIANIVDKQDFLERYEEIFDTTFKTMIIRSHSKMDWQSVGAKGIDVQK